MSNSDLIRSSCPGCAKKIGVRPDQLGKRVRCPACKLAFAAEPPAQPPPPPGPTLVTEGVTSNDEYADWLRANDANEIARAEPPKREWPKAKGSAPFPRSRSLTFQAAVQAARGCRCEILHLDWANCHLRFMFPSPASPPGEHDLYVFESLGPGCELDVSSREPNADGQYDPYYEALVRETGKYLLFAAEPQPLALPPPPAAPPRFRSGLRRRQPEGVDGLSVAGFVCGLVGLLTFCIPLLGGGLGVMGIVFGSIGINRKRGGGLAVAGLCLGIVACLLSFIAFLVFLEDAERRRRW